jgi:succinylglutamate desuccinylase
MVNALTHGNELCGMLVVKRLLDSGVRPVRGRLTFSLANVAAYERFGPSRLDSRFVDRDFNRVWRDDLIDSDSISTEAARARELRPVVRSVDLLLDIHSTWHALKPFFVLGNLPRARAFADRLGYPARQLFLPGVWHEGFHMIDYPPFRDPGGAAVGLIVECGQHFARSTAVTAFAAALRFLAVTEVIGEAEATRLGAAPEPSEAIERYEIVEAVLAATDDFRLACSYAGFEVFPKGAIAAWDGQEPVRAPFDGAVVLPPRPAPKRGQQAFAWARALTAGGPDPVF